MHSTSTTKSWFPRLVALSVALSFSVASPGCSNPDQPKYWAKKIKKPAFREQAIKEMEGIYLERLNAAKGDRQDPAVKEACDVMIPALVETFNKYKTDNAGRSAISSLLSTMQDPRGIPVFEELLTYQKGITETDASRAAETLGVLGSEESVPKIISMIDAVKADRGSEGRNRPEDDWMVRSGVEALGKILLAHPDSSHRAAAVATLNEALETTADQQDFFINKVAAVALGNVSDPQSIPVLIRGLFFQGRGATVFQQCRVALLRVSVEHRSEVIDQLFKAYKGEMKELEADAQRFSFFHGIKENKIGLMFYELRIDPQKDKAIFDLMLQRVKDPEIDKEGVLQGMAAETLAMLGYPGMIDYVLEITAKKEWYNDSFGYKIFASFMSGIVGTQSLKMPMSFDPRLAALFLRIMDEMKGDSNAPFRASGGLLVSMIGSAEDAKVFAELTEKEENQEVKDQLKGFNERFEVKKECGQDLDCWIGKLSVEDEKWRVRQMAALMVGQLAPKGDDKAVDALSGMLNQGKDASGHSKGTKNQDVMKAVFIALDELEPDGCTGKTCSRLALIIPYLRKKPQMAVMANSAEVLLAKLIQRKGGKVSEMDFSKAGAVAGE